MGDVGCLSAEVEPESAELVLIRHGETSWNEINRLQGQLESDLNAVGRLQAAAVAERLGKGELPFVAIYSSDLRRARETAEAIAKACGKGAEVRTKVGLRERHLGVLQGLTLHEARSKEPAAVKAFLSRSGDVPVPGGGESLRALQQRAAQTVEEIAAQHSGERVVVVCHGGVINALYEHITGHTYRGKVVNAAINVVVRSSRGSWSVKHWGDTLHLEGVGWLAQPKHVL